MNSSPEPRRERMLRLGLAGLLGGMATLHVIMPKPFEHMVPDYIPGDPKAVNLLAGVAEGGSALLLANRKTARLGGAAAAGTFLGVWIANIQAAIDGGYPVKGPLGSEAAAWIRVPLQIPMIAWALKVRRNASSLPSTSQQDTA